LANDADISLKLASAHLKESRIAQMQETRRDLGYRDRCVNIGHIRSRYWLAGMDILAGGGRDDGIRIVSGINVRRNPATFKSRITHKAYAA